MAGTHHKPTDKTRKLVRDMSIDGKTQEEMAKRLSISVETLVKYYDYEARHYKHDITYEIQDILIKKALEGKRWAVEKYLTCRADWAPARKPDDFLEKKKEYILVQYQSKEITNDNNSSNDKGSTDICV